MTFQLNHAELALMALTPEVDLVDLAVELDYVPEAQIDRVQLLGDLVPRLYELAQREGLPFSKYDAEDLGDLPKDHRAALADSMGWPSAVPDMIKRGEKVYRIYRRKRTNSSVAQLLPCLLAAVARYAHERQG